MSLVQIENQRIIYHLKLDRKFERIILINLLNCNGINRFTTFFLLHDEGYVKIRLRDNNHTITEEIQFKMLYMLLITPRIVIVKLPNKHQ